MVCLRLNLIGGLAFGDDFNSGVSTLYIYEFFYVD